MSIIVKKKRKLVPKDTTDYSKMPYEEYRRPAPEDIKERDGFYFTTCKWCDKETPGAVSIEEAREAAVEAWPHINRKFRLCNECAEEKLQIAIDAALKHTRELERSRRVTPEMMRQRFTI